MGNTHRLCGNKESKHQVLQRLRVCHTCLCRGGGHSHECKEVIPEIQHATLQSEHLFSATEPSLSLTALFIFLISNIIASRWLSFRYFYVSAIPFSCHFMRGIVQATVGRESCAEMGVCWMLGQTQAQSFSSCDPAVYPHSVHQTTGYNSLYEYS